MDINTKGAEQLLIGIYTEACGELLLAYRRQIRAPSRAAAESASEDIKRLEDWFMHDPYGLLTDPQGIIKAVKKKAKEGGWIKCPEFAKSEKFQEKRANE